LDEIPIIVRNPSNPTSSITAWVYSHPLWAHIERERVAWGDYRTNLLPDPGPDVRGRDPDKFFIHGGDVPGSKGCIDLAGSDHFYLVNDASHNFLRSYGKAIKLTVKYTCDPWKKAANRFPGGVGGGGGFGGSERPERPQDTGKRWIGGDRLSDCYKNLLKRFFAIDLADVSIHHYIPLGPRIWADPDGYMFGYDIYFKNYNPSTKQGFKDLLHELTHVQQFKEFGYIGFPKEYLKEYKQNRKKGMSDQDAYFNIRLEEEARQHAEETYKTIIADNYGKNPCAQ
jgi:hypothetical protein